MRRGGAPLHSSELPQPEAAISQLRKRVLELEAVNNRPEDVKKLKARPRSTRTGACQL